MDKKRVLAIDDDATIGELLKTGLEALEYDVDAVSNEPELWQSIEKNKPDVILMDIAMPGIDGIRLCRNIRLLPELRNIPIIMVSAFSDKRTYHDAMLFGGDDFLSKPFEISDVQKKIEDSLARLNTKNDKNIIR
ncbi:MAG: response regulator [Elusimicrobia bacterium]|nr:response regulator [Candidatus Liberimonas magnetica]